MITEWVSKKKQLSVRRQKYQHPTLIVWPRFVGYISSISCFIAAVPRNKSNCVPGGSNPAKTNRDTPSIHDKFRVKNPHLVYSKHISLLSEGRIARCPYLNYDNVPVPYIFQWLQITWPCCQSQYLMKISTWNKGKHLSNIMKGDVKFWTFKDRACKSYMLVLGMSCRYAW